VCSYCQSVDHDINSCPYYEISNDCHARLNGLIKTMKERHGCFVSGIREFDLLYDAIPSVPTLKLEVILYDDYESFHPLQSNFVLNTPSTALEEEIDPPLTHLLLLVLPTTPQDTAICVLTLLASTLPLALCTGLEISKPFRSGTDFVEDDSVVRAKQLTSIEPFVEEDPFE